MFNGALLDLHNTTGFFLSDKPRVAWCYLVTASCNAKIIIELQESQVSFVTPQLDEVGLLKSFPTGVRQYLEAFNKIHKCELRSFTCICELNAL